MELFKTKMIVHKGKIGENSLDNDVSMYNIRGSDFVSIRAIQVEPVRYPILCVTQ